MSIDLVKDIKDYVYRTPCPTCKGYLFLLHVDEKDKITEGTIYCADCDRKSKEYFYK